MSKSKAPVTAPVAAPEAPVAPEVVAAPAPSLEEAQKAIINSFTQEDNTPAEVKIEDASVGLSAGTSRKTF